MNGQGLVRALKAVSVVGAGQGLRVVRASWRRRAAFAASARRGHERARVQGSVVGAEPGPGGGVVRFERARLRITVTVSGAVFWGWDGAEPTPSYGVAGSGPEVDARAVLEPDKDGGWRVVSERATVAVSRHGGVQVCTPGGVLVRRDLPPRWWEPEGGGGARWAQRSEVPADARFFGLGGRAAGPRLRDGTYRLWNAGPGGAPGPGDDPSSVTMPVLVVVADAGTHLVFHDNTWDGSVALRQGVEGEGSGHDRPGACELRMAGGPLRCWVVVGTPARVLRTWTRLTGAALVPPSWGFGHHHERRGVGDESGLRRVVDGFTERALPLDAVHVGVDAPRARRAFTDDPERLSPVRRLAAGLRGDGVRLVSRVDAAVRDESGDAVRAAYEALRELQPQERPFVASRAGWVGMQRYGGVWSREPAAGWPGLRASLSMVVGLGLCGVPYAGCDVGGIGTEPSVELAVRRLQLGAHLPLFRALFGGRADGREAWAFGDEVDKGREVRKEAEGLVEHARGVLNERERLLPYFMTLAHLARRTGAPYVRPVWWAAPEDRGLRDCEDAFLLGDCLLVAPVLEPGVVRRTVRLPRGRWYDTVSEAVFEGPGSVTVDAPLSRIPVLARAGAVLAVRGESGGVEWEVWAPEPGRTGGALVVPEVGDGPEEPEMVRVRVRWSGGRVVVEEGESGGRAPRFPVRVRGLQASRTGRGTYM